MLERHSVVPRAALLVAMTVGLGACGPRDRVGEEDVGVVQSPVISNQFEFGKDTPSPLSLTFFASRQFLAQRISNGANGNWVASYVRFNSGTTHNGWTLAEAPTSAVQTTVRPAASWVPLPDTFSVIFRRESDKRVRDTNTQLGPEVFPTYPGQGQSCPMVGCTIGPPTALSLAVDNFTDDNGVFEIMGNEVIHQSYRPAGFWSDFPIFPPLHPVAGGPLVINRSWAGKAGASVSSDSVWFACGAASPARVCEFRRLPNQVAATYTTTIGSAFGSFVTGTRPTAISNYLVNGERWIFATVNQPEGGMRSILALKDSTPIDQTMQPTYSGTTIDSTPNAGPWFSTAMPYVRKDGKVAVVYFRSANMLAEVWQAIWNGSSWTKSKIHDTGTGFPGNNEPVPFTTTGGTALTDQTNSVFFRLPPTPGSPTMRDTVELIEDSSGKYTKSLLPAPFDTSNLYVIKGSSLYQVSEDAANCCPSPLGSGSWTGAISFVSDGVGLGYTVLNGELLEVNLNDGTRRKLGVESWTGTTHLAFGWDAADRRVPRLWAIRNNGLVKVTLADGTSTSPLSTVTGTQAMTYRESGGTAQDIYIVKGNNTLYKVNSNTGVQAQIGNLGDWPHTRGMTATPDGKLYICEGADDQHMRVWRLDPNSPSGQPDAWTSQFSNCQVMATVKGSAYVMKSRKVYRVDHTGGTTLSLVGVGSQNWDYDVIGMAGRDL
jgi:hypothetical protein